MAGPEVQTVQRGLNKKACPKPKKEKNVCCVGFYICVQDTFQMEFTNGAKCLSFVHIIQTQSWAEGPWWWYLWWSGLALTPVDVMVQWKMYWQLMEDLPVAAGRSVATGAMCVNLLPCHFFCLCPHPPFITTYFCFPFHPSRLHSLYLQSSVTNYSWRLICWLSKVLLVLAWRWGEREKRVHLPTPFLPIVITKPSHPHPPPAHLTHVSPQTQCWDVSVEIDILSRKISSD